MFPDRAETPPEMVVDLKVSGITELELNHLVYHKLSLLLINLLATTFCGEPWPKTLYPALQGGSEEAIIKTRVGIRLKSNVIPMQC